MILPDYALWIALFAFFAAEHVKFGDERVAILGLRARDRASVYITRSPIKIGQRNVYILPLIGTLETYYIGTFFLSEDAVDRSGYWEMRRISLTHRAISPFLILEPSLFLFYFVLCPILTIQSGLGVALRLIFPVHMAFFLVCAAMILWLPGLPLKGTMRRLGLVAEILICPGLMPALSKRLSSKLHVRADVPKSAAMGFSLRHSEQMRGVLSYRLEELVKFGETTPKAAEHYLGALGASE